MQPTYHTGLSQSNLEGVNSPVRYYPFASRAQDRSRANELQGRSVYLIINFAKKTCYVGKSAALAGRMASHRSAAEMKAPRKVYEQIHPDIEDYRWGVVYTEAEDTLCKSCAVVEREVVSYMKEKGYTLLNSDNGGGGGTGHHKAAADSAASSKIQNFKSPEKRYPVVRKGNRFQVLMSPGIKKTVAKANKRALETIYEFKVGEDYYVGKTNNVRRRVGEWCYYAARGDDKPLAQRLRDAEIGDSSFRVRTVVSPSKVGADVERAYIENSAQKGRTLLNRDNGGGGPIGENVAERMKMHYLTEKENHINQIRPNPKEEVE